MEGDKIPAIMLIQENGIGMKYLFVKNNKDNVYWVYREKNKRDI